MNLATFANQLPRVEIEGEWAEANPHNGPLEGNLRNPWEFPGTLV
jgi:hypothetical protein